MRAHSRIAAKATQQKRSGTKGETGYTSYGIASTGSVRALGTTQRCAHILTRITSQLPHLLKAACQLFLLSVTL